MRFQGKVQNWNDDKGFGFVEPNGGGTRAFVHIKAFKPRARRPVNGDIIIYEVVQEKNNRSKAINIAFARDMKKSRNQSKTNSGGSFGYVLTLCFGIGLLISVAIGKLPIIILGLYFVLSLLTFIAYAIDKSAAQNDSWRTKESTLHLLSLLGGWPGAYFAQSKLRHKSSKKEFKRVYWVTVFINLASLFWLYTEKGSDLLNKLVTPLMNSL